MNITKYFLILYGILLLLACGCSKKISSLTGTEPVKIKVALTGPYEANVIVSELLGKWQKEHEGIAVEVDYTPQFYSDKILTEIAADSAPDIIFCDGDIFVPFFFKDVFLDLTSFVESDKSFDIKRFYPETLKKFESNRKLYCLPAGSRSSGIIYYNKDLFKRSGAALPDDNWNTTEFLAAAKRLTADANGRHPGDKAFDPGRITTYGYAGRTWENFVYSFGGRFVDRWDDPAKCLLNENLAVAGMQFAMDLSYKQGVSPRPGVPVNGGSDRGLFVSGQLGMFQSSIGDLPDLRKEIGDRFGWDVVLFPKGPSGKRGFPTDVSGYAIYQMTGHPQEAWEVLKCLTGEAGQAMLADAGILHPSDMKIAQGEHWAANPLPPANKKALNDAVQYSEYEPFHQMWREAWDRNGAPRIELILDNKMPVKQGLDDITIDMNEFLSHR